jgi:hypothetical protein
VATVYSQSLRQSDVHVSDRQGKSLLSGGDIEIGIISCDMGLGMAVFPELRLTHLIPRERITEDYLLKIFEGTSLSNYLLAYKWRSAIPRNPLTILGLLELSANALILRGIERKKFFAGKRAARKALGIIRHPHN